MLGQTTEKGITLSRVRRLVGDAPDDDVRTVMVTMNHICQLLFSILEGLRILPVDRPIAGNLRPHHDTHALCLAYHILIMRIVSQTHEVTTQFLSPRE